MLTISNLKEAIKESDKQTVRDVLKNYSEDVLKAAIDLDIRPSDIEECYQGEFRNDVDFAQEMAEQLDAIKPNQAWPYTCIDWKFAAKELMYDYAESGGHYFRNI